MSKNVNNFQIFDNCLNSVNTPVDVFLNALIKDMSKQQHKTLSMGLQDLHQEIRQIAETWLLGNCHGDCDHLHF